MLKYPVKGKIITVHGEEEYMIIHLISFRFVEVEGEFIETPFQHFEEVLPEITVAKLAAETPRQMARMASLEDARAAIKEGKNSAWGQLPDIPHKTDKFGLGFTAAGQKAMRRSKIERAPVKISPYGINALEDEDKESSIEEWIYPTVKGGLCNWEAKDFVPITFIHQ